MYLIYLLFHKNSSHQQRNGVWQEWVHIIDLWEVFFFIPISWNHEKDKIPTLHDTGPLCDWRVMQFILPLRGNKHFLADLSSWWFPLLFTTQKSQGTPIWHSLSQGIVNVSSIGLQSPDPSSAAKWHQLVRRVGVFLHRNTTPFTITIVNQLLNPIWDISLDDLLVVRSSMHA